jgi:dihydroorotate dehydrogenase (fumarate)
MTEPVDLATSYLGLRLAHPFVVGASPLLDDVDTARRLQDAGAAALVMRSLFEEQITTSQTGRVHQMDPFDPAFRTVLSYFPEPEAYQLGPDQYLEVLRRLKAAVSIPVIASLNGMSVERWLMFARDLEEAGADAVELNLYEVVSDLNQSGAAVERDTVRAVLDLKQELRIPVAIKLSPYFTSFGYLARELDRAGADGLVLFNRFYQADFDVERLSVTPHLELSTSAELLLRLRWLAILYGRIRASLIVCGGVAEPLDGIKAILAGADAVQMVSAILRHGPAHLGVMKNALAQWMEAHAFRTLNEVRGRLSLTNTPDPASFERASYLRTIIGWRPTSALP